MPRYSTTSASSTNDDNSSTTTTATATVTATETSYEMRKIPKKENSSKSSSHNELTRENVRRFEEEQEHEARKRRQHMTSPSLIGSVQKPSPIPSTAIVRDHFQQNPHDRQQENQQVFVLDRVIEMDEAKDEDDKYKCCCRCTNVYRGAWWVGFMEAIIAATALITVIVIYTRLGRNYLDHFVATVSICVGYMVILTFHFCGLQGKSSCLLIPNLLLQLASMVLFCVTIILISLILTSDDQAPLVIWAGMGPLYGDLAKEAGLNLLTVGLILIGACCLAFLVYIWFFYICFKCYRYVNEQRRRRGGLVYSESGGEKAKIGKSVPK